MHIHSAQCGHGISKNELDKLANINIPVEYELIKQKKSNLSASLRKLVVEKYEK